MKKELKNQTLRALKTTVTSNGHWNIEIKSALRYSDSDPKDPGSDWEIDLYQLDEEGNRTDTFHPIEKVIRVADVYDLSVYVTIPYDEKYIKIHLF
jgi:hypothetical protein